MIAKRTAGLLVEVFPAGTVGQVKYEVRNVGPVKLKQEAAIKALLTVAHQMTVAASGAGRGGVAALDAVLRDDELGAAVIMANMTPDALYELTGACLVTVSLARESLILMANPIATKETTFDE